MCEVLAADSGQRYDACHERDDRRDQQDAVQAGGEGGPGDRSHTCLAGAGSRAITLPICPDCTAPAISGPRVDSPGTAAVRVSTSSFTSWENSVPSRAMPVAMPTWRKVELMPEAMPACCGGTTPTAVEASGGFTRPTPTPATIIPGMRWVQVEPALSPRISSRLTPMMIRPGPISSRTGTREESLPATVALTRMAPDRYITRTPVPSGE